MIMLWMKYKYELSGMSLSFGGLSATAAMDEAEPYLRFCLLVIGVASSFVMLMRSIRKYRRGE